MALAPLESTVATVLRDTLKTIPEITSLVTLKGQQKIFWQHVDDTIPMPYITTSHYLPYGEKDPRYSDDLWLVIGHTGDMAVANQFANAISKLDTMMPDTTAFEEVCAYAPLRKSLPYFYRYQVQNRPLFKVGSIIRVRLYLGSLT